MSLIDFLTRNYLCLIVCETEKLYVDCLKKPDRLISFYVYKNANDKLEYFKDRLSKPVRWGATQERRNMLVEVIDEELRENGLD